ncbi:IclR family transcriptional regulator [Desulfosporosinus sp. FKB]|uniref:IclR family transcriptional regulator n=1 Tax=Desulfosporosinus sp. FKB TaxID=1969835 RepID=UPI000B4A08E5|nr:IclR family transcriptional regulator [Desulfosporosinus sp. FKB]
MRLKEKTHRKFVDFFEKISNMYQGQDFELAYSDIQRETGAASVTLKRAIQALAEDGVLDVQPGRNSRYARFRYLLATQTVDGIEPSSSEKENDENPTDDEQQNNDTINENLQELLQLVDHLRRRVRNQEMSIALLQDRMAEIEDKLRKR